MVNPLGHWLWVTFFTRSRIPLRGLYWSWGIGFRIHLRGLSGFWVPPGLVVPETKSRISAVSLWAGRSMNLLMARLDPYIILLVGRWCSDTMLCYYHTTQRASHKVCHQIFFNIAYMHSFLQRTPETSVNRNSRSLKAPSPRGFGGLVQDQCGIGEFNISF